MTETTGYSAKPAWPQAPTKLWEQSEAPSDVMKVDFVGRRGALFWLALKTGFWTILTLGFYRFWMKTRLRRWYWSAMRPGGHPMEYVGDPMEKLLGFFIAVVVLTFYIGIVNLLLMFVSFSVFNASWVGYLASFAGVIPVWFYARYRARRYVLGRTRWRGVRFGLEKGAWGYAGRALFYWALTILSAGILWPRMTFLLEKYKTDRTYFGSAKLVQGGRWTMLYGAALPFIAAVCAIALWAAQLIWFAPLVTGEEQGLAKVPEWFGLAAELGFIPVGWHNPARLWLAIPLGLLLLYGAIHYRWAAKQMMANHKHSKGVRFASALIAPRISMIYALGTFISYAFLVIGIGLLALLVFWIWGRFLFMESSVDPFQGLPDWVGYAVLIPLYLGVFLMWGVLHNTFVTFPIMRHMAATTTLPKTEGIKRVSQRARDEFAEAEGFAEALDLGAAI